MVDLVHVAEGITPAAIRGLSISRLEAELNAAIRVPPVSEATTPGKAANPAAGTDGPARS